MGWVGSGPGPGPWPGFGFGSGFARASICAGMLDVGWTGQGGALPGQGQPASWMRAGWMRAWLGLAALGSWRDSICFVSQARLARPVSDMNSRLPAASTASLPGKASGLLRLRGSRSDSRAIGTRPEAAPQAAQSDRTAEPNRAEQSRAKQCRTEPNGTEQGRAELS